MTGGVITLPVARDMLGRIFNGRGEPIDGGTNLTQGKKEKKLDLSGMPENQFSRDNPSGFIQTGISAIDGLNPLVRGQKLPIFSASGLPHNRLAAQIARQSTVIGDEDFAVVFAAVGVTFEEAAFFMEDFRSTGAMRRAVLYVNMEDDPAAERVNTPRMALAAAEYLAFEHSMHVLVILTDLAGCPYTDLTAMCARAGRLKGRHGSITLMPIMTVSGDGKVNMVALTSYVAEGQIILSRAMHHKGIYPPVDVLPSTSRLRDNGIGNGMTREDHADLINQLYTAYARGREAKELAAALGDSALNQEDKSFAAFAEAFEDKYIRQGEYENRPVKEGSLELGWELLTMIPVKELKRVRDSFIEKYLKPRLTAKAGGKH